MNPLQRVARNPIVYRWLVLPARPIAELLESFLRFVTAGRVGVLDLAGLPCVRITSKGRKTGLARTTTVQYVPVDDGLVLVGSNWGLPHHPAWSANLQAAERVTVRGRGEFSPQRRGWSPGRNATGRGPRSWRTGRIIRSLRIRAGARQFRLFLLTPTTNGSGSNDPCGRVG